MTVRRFIRSFSYKNKLRFVLLTSYLPVFVLLAAIPLLLNGPISDLTCKKKSLKALERASVSYMQGLPEIESAEKGMEGLKQDPELVCALSLLQRDNGGRRLLQAVDWEMPESRSALAGLLSTALAAHAVSFYTLTQVEVYREKLLESSERAIAQLELAYRSNTELIPLTREMHSWKEEVAAFAALFNITSQSNSTSTNLIRSSGFALLKNTLALQQKLYAQSEKILETQISTLKKARLISLATLLAGALLVALLYISENMRKPLMDLKKALLDILKGIPSSMPLTSHDEMRPVALAYNQLADYVKEFWKDIERIKKHMADTFEQISMISGQLDDTIESEVAQTNLIAKGSRDIRSRVQTLTEELIGASRSAVATGELAATGDEGLHQMEAIMQELLKASSTIVSTLSDLQQEVGTVNQVILAIVKIADQSNLLSLNTAIRASKSGAEGKGFAVIADRIREMADQIAHITLDIEKSVQEVILTVLEAAERVAAFSDNIRKHVQDTGEVSAKLKQLISATQNQVSHFERIKEEMQSQLQQISHITQITTDIKKNAAASHLLAGKLRSEMPHSSGAA